MLMVYMGLMGCLLSLVNVYVVWLVMEVMFLVFLIVVLSSEGKNSGLIIYFFFQSVMSLVLWVSMFSGVMKLVVLLLVAKLGMFPFFYWLVAVSVKIGWVGNMFVLSLQKVSVFWLVWLLFDVSLVFMYGLVYMSMFFVIGALLMVSDMWLLLVYSSIANTGMLMLSSMGSNYMYGVGLYLGTILMIIGCMSTTSSYEESMMVVYMFLVVPPLVLFFMKFYVILSLDFFMKVGLFLVVFDAMILLYYFSLIFMSFMLMDVSMVIYLFNLLVLGCVVIFSNCVTMSLFD